MDDVTQGGRRQENIGGAPCSDDDVIISMTSLLLIYFGKILGGPGPPRPPHRRPPCLKPTQFFIPNSLCFYKFAQKSIPWVVLALVLLLAVFGAGLDPDGPGGPEKP